ncbi:ankyrin repeat and fibronectin type-III domain-containing protein 1 isoform X1 [Hetaerina americana]|uniref:ankyrin repeat and fibronectin type-III domain-containing protein 1 isoform X1 n=1 Tax=Hetaerina americana TaxID=62018 RepID=UPI003A7F1E74
MSLLSPSVGRRIKGARLAIERSHPAGMEFLSDGLSRTKAGKKKVDKLNKINIHLHALFAAVEHGHVDKARTILESTDVDVNSVNGDGLSPLDIAVLHNDRPLAKTLLAFGAKEGQSYESQEALRMHLRHLLQDAESRVEALGGSLLIDPYDAHLHHHLHHHHNSASVPAMAHGHHQQNHHRSHHHHHHTVQYNEGGGVGAGDKQLLLWERRAKGIKKMLLGFDQARPPDEPFLVAVDVTGTNSLAVRFQEPENQDSAICTKFKVEWSCSEDFSLVIGEREVLRGAGGGGSSSALPSGNLVRGRPQGGTSYIGGFGPGDNDGRLASRWPLECHVTDLCQGQRYYFRVACGNLKGFGPFKISSPASVVPSSWRDVDSRSPRLAGRLQMLEDLFAQVRSSRPENASEIKELEPSSSSSTIIGVGGGGGSGSGAGSTGGSGLGSGGDTPLPSRRNHRKKTTTSIKQLFTAASKFQKNLRRGVYLACLLYHEDKVLVTNEDFLPVIEVDEAYPNSIYGDFHWLMKVACTWDDVKSLKQDMDRCSGSTAVQFRNKLLQASAQMQTALCIQDLGQLHHRPIRDSQGTLVFSAVNCVRSPKAVSSGLNARWVPLSKVLQKQRLPLISPQGSYQQFNPCNFPIQPSSCSMAPPSSSTSSISSLGTTASSTSTSSSNNPSSSSGYSSLCSATLLSSQQHYQASVQGSGASGIGSSSGTSAQQDGPNVGDMLMASIQEQIAYHQSCGVRLGRGLYLSYLKMRSSVDLIQVLVPMKTPNILPHCKIRDNPHVSAEEWAWLKRLSARHKGVKKERRWLFSPDLDDTIKRPGDALEGIGDSKEMQRHEESEADTGAPDEDMDDDDDDEGNETQRAFIQLVSATARRLLAYVEVGAEDALSHRLWDAEVVEVSSEVSLLVVVPPAEASCAAPGQKEALLRRPDLLPLPVQAFEVAHLSAYQREFICRYARLSSILEIDTIIAQHSHREAFSSAEVSAAKDRLAQLSTLSTQLNLAWQGARWLMDALTFARDRSSSSAGIPLHRLLQPPTPLLAQPALSILPPRRASSGGGEMSTGTGGGSSRGSPLDGDTGGNTGAGLLFLQLPKGEPGATGSVVSSVKGKLSKKAAAAPVPPPPRWVPGVGMGGGLCGEHSKSEQQLHARASQDSANASPASTVSDVGTRLPPSRSEDHLHGRGRKGSQGGGTSLRDGEAARLGMVGADMGWGSGPGLRAHSDSTLPLVKRAGRRVTANGVGQVVGVGLHSRPSASAAHRPYGSLLGVSDGGAVGEAERVQSTASGSEETVSISSDGAGCWAGVDPSGESGRSGEGDRPMGEDYGVDPGEIVDLGEIDNDVDCEEEDDMVGSRGAADDTGSELQVYAAYETGLAPGTSVRLHVTRETTAREVVDLVVQQLSMAAVLKGKSGPVYAGAQRLRSFCLVAVIGARERCLRDDFRPLMLQNPWRRGRLYIRMRHDLLAAIQHSSRHSAYL